MDKNLKKALKFQNFDLLGWKQQNKHNTKESKIHNSNLYNV